MKSKYKLWLKIVIPMYIVFFSIMFPVRLLMAASLIEVPSWALFIGRYILFVPFFVLLYFFGRDTEKKGRKLLLYGLLSILIVHEIIAFVVNFIL